MLNYMYTDGVMLQQQWKREAISFLGEFAENFQWVDIGNMWKDAWNHFYVAIVSMDLPKFLFLARRELMISHDMSFVWMQRFFRLKMKNHSLIWTTL